ncbi:hypothetical protein [Pedosphaera parvula]|uniref:Uncharacterized protein n=1 Tax=Pedosphaera parvula (strain Ellin514) TaxID=320771 RepID=B9XBY1_PEDPL|nr:hypothetical protein [Pedosphaera parvula]EEF62449.1 hypothetical protein Cflav_PD5084 [Pedosphaera parvula Ellin514]
MCSQPDSTGQEDTFIKFLHQTVAASASVIGFLSVAKAQDTAEETFPPAFTQFYYDEDYS